MKLGELIKRIAYLELKQDLLQRIVRDIGSNRGIDEEFPSDLIAEVQADIDQLLRAPVEDELENLKGKEVQDGPARNPPKRRK